MAESTQSVISEPSESGQHVLSAYLIAEPGEQEDELLRQLIVGIARPVVQRVVHRRFFSSRYTNAEDQEDVCSDAIAAVLARVRLLRTLPGAVAIGDFESFAAGVATRIASRFFMARTPQRTMLRTRLRYVLTTDSRFRIWEGDSGSWLCGMAGRSGPVVLLPAVDIEACRVKLNSTQMKSPRLPAVVESILHTAGGAMELSTLTTLAAGWIGISDNPASNDDAAAKLASPEPDAGRQAEMRQLVRELWGEVCALPVLQRRALLLNLGSSGAGGTQATAWLIPELGIATFRTLAEKLEMSPEDLAAVWNLLPLPDSDIAARLGLDRQQVINLRSAGRQRLARRLQI